MRKTPLCELTPKGIELFKRYVTADASGSAPAERGEDLSWLFASSELCRPVPGAGPIDADRVFKDALDFCRHVFPAFDPVGADQMVDNPGVNAFLNAVYIRQLIVPEGKRGGGALRTPNAYIMDIRAVDPAAVTRNYRNTLYSVMSFYLHHRDSEGVCRAYLSKPVHLLSNALERVVQKPDLVSSRGAVELIAAMLIEPGTSDFRRVEAAPGGAAPLPGGAALDRLSRTLFTQCACNFDVENMTARQLLSLVPQDGGLDHWRGIASQTLAA